MARSFLNKRISKIAKKSCHMAIVKILVDSHTEYTRNKNGVFSMSFH